MLLAAIDARMVEVHTSIPAVVTRYDPAKGLIDAAPQVKRAYQDEEGQRATAALPVIVNVPLIFPGSGGGGVTFPISVGDPVWLSFSEASIDEWKSNGGVVDPANSQRHGLAGAVAFPGLRTFGSPVGGVSTSATVIRADSSLQLGSSSAVQSVVKGTTYRAAEDTLLTALGVFATAMGVATPAAAPAAAALNTAIVTFLGASATYLSTKVKTE